MSDGVTDRLWAKVKRLKREREEALWCNDLDTYEELDGCISELRDEIGAVIEASKQRALNVQVRSIQAGISSLEALDKWKEDW